MGGMEDSRHYKARLEEAMATLKMSSVGRQGKIKLERTPLPKEECFHKRLKHKVYNFSKMFNPSKSVRGPLK